MERARDDLAELWRSAREQLRGSLPEATFRLWLEPLKAVSMVDGTVYLSAPERVREWVRRRYAELLRAALQAQSPAISDFELLAPGGAAPADAAAGGRPSLGPGNTFERFVIGPGNRFAHAAALAVAETPSHAYNPLFLHGPPGLGKTHLLGAIAHYIRRRDPAAAVHYTTAESFTSEFVRAVRGAGTEAFKERYREIDVLLVDDVQFLEGKSQTQQELFHTFNALHAGGSQIVLSSDRPPRHLAEIEERLRDRFEWGLIVELAAPDVATRLTVLQRLARESAISLVDLSPLREIAGRVAGNLRQLEGALTRVSAFSSLTGRPIDATVVGEALGGQTQLSIASEPTIEQVQEAVCEELGVSREALLGRGRDAATVRARQLAIYLGRAHCGLSYPELASAFGRRDHTTALHSVRRVETQLGDSETSTHIEAVRNRLGFHSQPTAVA